MKQQQVDGIKALLDQRMPSLLVLKISWFGGEPLLRYPSIVEIMQHAQETSQRINPGLRLLSNMTTNGYLLSVEHLENLVGLGVDNYQISFDGDREEHNKLRVLVDGRGTFDRIWGNVIDAHRSEIPFKIMIRMHVNTQNERSMAGLIRKISDELGADERFFLYIRNLSRLGGAHDEELPIQEDEKACNRLITMAKDAGLQVRSFEFFSGENRYVCYAAKPNAYVIRANGTLSKCTVGLYADHNLIGVLSADGKMRVDSEKALLWSRGVFSGNKAEMECPAINFPVEKLHQGMVPLRTLNQAKTKSVC